MVTKIIDGVHALLIKFKCPKCNVDNSYSLADSNYQGPYRCWKCRELFAIEIVNNELKSCEPLTQEEFERKQRESERQQEIESLKAKFKKD